MAWSHYTVNNLPYNFLYLPRFFCINWQCSRPGADDANSFFLFSDFVFTRKQNIVIELLNIIFSGCFIMPRCRKFSQRKRRGERKPDVKKCHGGDGSNCESKSKCQTLKKAASVFTTYSRENRQSNLHKENGDCTEIDIYYLENQNTAPSNDGFQDLLQQSKFTISKSYFTCVLLCVSVLNVYVFL